MELAELSLVAARQALRKGDCSASELLEAFLTRIARAGALNLFDALDEDGLRAEARRIDDLFAKGEAEKHPLLGLPVGIKDIFCVEGRPSSAASRILQGFHPPYEAEVVARLRGAGALLAGRLNMDEFAMGSSNETSFYGAAVNPWRAEGSADLLAPGGSSGGSAAAVAAGLVPAALGSDTGGSVRQPAALTGTVGLRPTYGRCSRYGMIAFASSLDQAGPLARNVADAALLFEAIAGRDDKDSTSARKSVPSLAKESLADMPALRIASPHAFDIPELGEEARALWQQSMRWMKEVGAQETEADLPHMKYALPAYYLISSAEASSNLARYDGVRYGHRAEADQLEVMYERTRAEGFGAEVKRRIMIGTYALSAGYYDAYYLKAQRMRNLIAQEFSALFEKADIVVAPSTPDAAFRLGEKNKDPLAMYANDVFSVPASLAGLPAISLPVGLSKEGLPLAVQLIAAPFAEAKLFQAAYLLEQAAGFNARPERWWEKTA